MIQCQIRKRPAGPSSAETCCGPTTGKEAHPWMGAARGRVASADATELPTGELLGKIHLD